MVMLYNILDIATNISIISINLTSVVSNSMNSLIFLGIIPGTNIQINFVGWLLITMFFSVIFGYILSKNKFLSNSKLKNKYNRTLLYSNELHFKPNIFGN